MTKTYYSLALTAVFLLSSCSTQEVKNPPVAAVNTVPVQQAPVAAVQQAGTPQPASTQPKDGNYPGHGRVTKINADLPSVELNHREIVGVMPAMIMEFYVKDKSLLDNIKVGDEVDFVLEYKHPSETIVSITKAK